MSCVVNVCVCTSAWFSLPRTCMPGPQVSWATGLSWRTDHGTSWHRLHLWVFHLKSRKVRVRVNLEKLPVRLLVLLVLELCCNFTYTSFRDCYNSCMSSQLQVRCGYLCWRDHLPVSLTDRGRLTLSLLVQHFRTVLSSIGRWLDNNTFPVLLLFGVPIWANTQAQNIFNPSILTNQC